MLTRAELAAEQYAGLSRNSFAFGDVGELVGVPTHDNDR
jgi:hypothetical protein